MTKRECAIVMAYTGVVMLQGADLNIFYQYAEEIMGEPIFTHMLPMVADALKVKSEHDFLNLCANATD